MKRLAYSEPVDQPPGKITADQIEYLSKPVRFTMRHCSTKRKDCISNVVKDKSVLQALYNRFGHFEAMNWQQAKGIDHASCISIESKSSTNHIMMKTDFPRFNTFCHVRVPHKTKTKFRVFGALINDIFCVLKFDVDGDINH